MYHWFAHRVHMAFMDTAIYGMGHHSAVLMPHGVSLAIFLLIPGAKLLKVSIERIY